MEVSDVRNNQVTLANGKRLTGPLVVQHLASAEHVVVMLCTIGPRLSNSVSRAFATDPALGLALDAVGSAAVHTLNAAACNKIETDGGARGMQTSLPLSPGLLGWPVEVAQREIFR